MIKSFPPETEYLNRNLTAAMEEINSKDYGGNGLDPGRSIVA